jgi:hypothetical protein
MLWKRKLDLWALEAMCVLCAMGVLRPMRTGGYVCAVCVLRPMGTGGYVCAVRTLQSSFLYA